MGQLLPRCGMVIVWENPTLSIPVSNPIKLPYTSLYNFGTAQTWSDFFPWLLIQPNVSALQTIILTWLDLRDFLAAGKLLQALGSQLKYLELHYHLVCQPYFYQNAVKHLSHSCASSPHWRTQHNSPVRGSRTDWLRY